MTDEASSPGSTRRAERTYDALSRWYDALAEGSEREPRDFGLEKLGVRPGETVLEIGVGTGHGVVSLARSVGSTGTVVGVDIARGMLGRAAIRVARARLPIRVGFVRADATCVPFRDASFDAIFMSFVLELFSTADSWKVLAECTRVLKKDGRLGVVSLTRVEPPGVMSILYEWAHRNFPTWIDCRPIGVRDVLERAGFEIVDALRISTWGLPTAVVVARIPS